MKTLIMNITLDSEHTSEDFYKLLSESKCVADYEFVDEYDAEYDLQKEAEADKNMMKLVEITDAFFDTVAGVK